MKVVRITKAGAQVACIEKGAAQGSPRVPTV